MFGSSRFDLRKLESNEENYAFAEWSNNAELFELIGYLGLLFYREIVGTIVMS